MAPTSAPLHAQKPPPSAGEGPRPGSVRSVALAAALGVLGVYCVFYLRFPDTVATFVAAHGALGAALGGLSLLILVALAGAWAVFCGVSNLKAAFTTGMGVPGLIFGVGLAGGSGAPQAPGAPGGPAADGGRRPALVADSLGLVLSPVRSVMHARVQPVQRALDLSVELSGSAGGAPALLDAAEDPRVRAELLESIGRRPPRAPSPALDRSLRALELDKDPAVRDAALRALRRMPGTPP